MDSILLLENYASSIEPGAMTRGLGESVSKSIVTGTTEYPDFVARCYQGRAVTRSNSPVEPASVRGTSHDSFYVTPTHKDSFIYIQSYHTATRGFWWFYPEDSSWFPDHTNSARVDLPVGTTVVIDRLTGRVRMLSNTGIYTNLTIDESTRELIQSDTIGFHIQYSTGDRGLIATEVTRDGEGILPMGTTTSIADTREMSAAGEIPSTTLRTSPTTSTRSLASKVWARDATDETRLLTLFHLGEDMESRPYVPNEDPLHAQHEWLLGPLEGTRYLTLRSIPDPEYVPPEPDPEPEEPEPDDQ